MMTILLSILSGLGLGVIALLLTRLLTKNMLIAVIVGIIVAIGSYFPVYKVISKTPSYEVYEFQKQLKTNPLFKLIEEKHPEEFKVYLNKVKKILEEKKTSLAEKQAQIQVNTAELINGIFTRYLAHAPDDQIYNFVKNVIDLYRYVYVISPEDVVKLETSQPISGKLLQQGDFEKHMNTMLEAKADIIKGSIKNETPIPSNQAAVPLITNVMNGLADKYGSEKVKLFTSGKLNALPSDQAALLIIDFYVGVYDSGKEKAGKIIRFIAGVMVTTSMEPKA